MLGKGLESLIPPKSGDSGSINSPAHSAHQSPHQAHRPVSDISAAPFKIHEEPAAHSAILPPLYREPVARIADIQPRPKDEAIFHIEVEKIRPNPQQPR